ncbi:hypothetical protein BGX34_006807 [Mortierella sp. NVP85]|nr:hypothetical protein BGX34_006807 [Mortierella sp. NVP85]
MGVTCALCEVLLLREKKRPEEERGEVNPEEELEDVLLHFMFLKKAIEEALVSIIGVSWREGCVFLLEGEEEEEVLLDVDDE